MNCLAPRSLAAMARVPCGHRSQLQMPGMRPSQRQTEMCAGEEQRHGRTHLPGVRREMLRADDRETGKMDREGIARRKGGRVGATVPRGGTPISRLRSKRAEISNSLRTGKVTPKIRLRRHNKRRAAAVRSEQREKHARTGNAQISKRRMQLRLRTGGKQAENRVGELLRRQRHFILEKLVGQTDKDAAIAAGYSMWIATNTKQKIWARPGVREEYERLYGMILKVFTEAARDQLAAKVETPTP